jgi:hypothetical protein
MDKKNVQNKMSRIFYANSVDCEHILKLWCGRKKNNFYFVTINFGLKNRTFFNLAMFWQYLAIFSIAKIAKKFYQKFYFQLLL